MTETENEPKRKRRKIVIDWKEDQKRPPRRSDHRPRPTFDRSLIRTILIAVLLIAVLIGAGFVGINSTRNATERRNFDLRPRNTDIWAVYPDGSLRFVTLTFDTKPAAGEDATLDAQVAGPLITSGDDVTDRAVIGGSLKSAQEYTGPGNDSGLIYELFTLTRDSYTKPYGVDVTCRSAPYINLDPTTGSTILSLGTKAQDQFQQVIVAVALPLSATITDMAEVSFYTGMQPYRKTKVDNWQVLYFDVTQSDGTQAIHVYYSLPQGSSQPDLDYMKIDRRR